MYRDQNKSGSSNASPDGKKSSCGMDLCVNQYQGHRPEQALGGDRSVKTSAGFLVLTKKH